MRSPPRGRRCAWPGSKRTTSGAARARKSRRVHAPGHEHRLRRGMQWHRPRRQTSQAHSHRRSAYCSGLTRMSNPTSHLFTTADSHFFFRDGRQPADFRPVVFFAVVFFALVFTRSGSVLPPVSRFHSSNVSAEILPWTRSSANFRRCAWLLNGTICPMRGAAPLSRQKVSQQKDHAHADEDVCPDLPHCLLIRLHDPHPQFIPGYL